MDRNKCVVLFYVCRNNNYNLWRLNLKQNHCILS